MKKIFKVPHASTSYSAAILVLRIVVGLALMYHGWKKINNPLAWMGEDNATPALLQAMAAISEYVGGLFVMIGLLTPLSAFGILCTMAVATYKHAIVKGDAFVGKGGSYELALVYFCVMLLVILAGAGRFSADRLIFGERK